MIRVDRSEGYLTLSSGKQLQIGEGVIGIDVRDNPSMDWVTIGYDRDECIEEWTEEDRTELANFMIGRWKRFGGIE